MVNVEVVEVLLRPFAMNEVKKALGIMENGKASEPTEIVKKQLATSPYGKQVMLQIANEIIDGKNMLHDWTTLQLTFIRKNVSLWTVRAIECKAFRAWYESGGKVVGEEVEKVSES